MLGSTVINLFALAKVNLVEQLQDLSVTKTGQNPMAISTETFVTPEAEPTPLTKEEIEAEHDASPLVDDKKTKVKQGIAAVRLIITFLMAPVPQPRGVRCDGP